jgi:alpha-beta hydrolase superfamily lysophospholipase
MALQPSAFTRSLLNERCNTIALISPVALTGLPCLPVCLCRSEARSWWEWRGHRIAYQQSGSGPIQLVLVHGLGASSDHWQRLKTELGSQYTVYALDMLGFGFTARPSPNLAGGHGHLYNFDTWCEQLVDFIEQVRSSRHACDLSIRPWSISL